MSCESVRKETIGRAMLLTRAFEKGKKPKLSWIQHRYSSFLADIEKRFCSTDLPVAVFQEYQFCFCFFGWLFPMRAILAPEFMCLLQNLLCDVLWVMWEVRFDYFNNHFSQLGISNRLSTSFAFFSIYKRKIWKAVLSNAKWSRVKIQAKT